MGKSQSPWSIVRVLNKGDGAYLQYLHGSPIYLKGRFGERHPQRESSGMKGGKATTEWDLVKPR
jgi:hypothetical protein